MITVVTALIGPTPDQLAAVSPLEGVRYVCITDRGSVPAGWELFHVEPGGVMAARRAKILAPFFFQGPTLWMDAAFRLTCDPRTLRPLLYDGYAVWMFRHPDRQTTVEEAKEVERLGLVKNGLATRQATLYRETIHPPQLVTTGFLLREDTKTVRTFSEVWWQEMERWRHPRDQMSVNYALHEAGLDCGFLDGTYRKNPYAIWTKYR